MLVPKWVGLCTPEAPVGLSNDLSCEAGSLSCCRPNPRGCFQSEVCMGCTVCFTPCRLSRFICAGMWDRGVLPTALPALFSTTLSLLLSVYLRECGAPGSASGQTPCPVGPTLHQSRSRHCNVSPLCPGCPSPPLLPVWMNVYFVFTWCHTSLPFDFLSVLVVRRGEVCLPTPLSCFWSGFRILRV